MNSQPFPAMWSSWFLWWDPSVRFLIDSSASKIEAYFCLVFFNCATCFSVLITLKFARHCGWHRNFQLSTHIFHDILEFHIRWINEVNTTQSSGIVKLRFLDSLLLLLFAFRCIGHIFPNFWPQSVWPGRCLFSCQSPPRPCIHIRWFSFNIVNLVKPVHIYDTFLNSINVPIVIDVLLQHYIQGCICSPGNIDKFQWNREWFFSRHVQFDSGFQVMTVNKVSWNGPEIIPTITIILRWVSKWVWAIPY